MRMLITTWIAGQLLFLFQVTPHAAWEIFLLGGIACLAFVLYLGLREHTWQYNLLMGLLGIGCAVGGYAWTQALDQQKKAQGFDPRLEGQSHSVRAYIDDLPNVSAKGVGLTLSLQDPPSGWPQKVAVFYPQKMPHQVFIPGQLWDFTLTLKKIHGYQNPHGFDLERWLYLRGIGAKGTVKESPQLIEQAWQRDYFFPRLRYAMREKITRSLGHDAPYLGVVNALVIGDQSLIRAGDWQLFHATGIGHLISISGLHITMLAALGAGIAGWCWRRTRGIYFLPVQQWAACVGFMTAFFYTCLAGFQIPAQRTMIMLGVAALGMIWGRIIHAFDLWFWALWLVLCINPWAIYFPGFWLSFGAVAAILFGMQSDSFQAHDADLVFLQKMQQSLGDAARVQAVVTIALIPFSLYWFYQISLVSPFANAVAIPVVSFIVTPCAMLGAFLPSWLGDLFLWLAHVTFSGLAQFLEMFSHVPLAVLHGAKPSAIALFVSLLGVVLCIRPGPILLKWPSRILGLILCLSLFIPPNDLYGKKIPHGELAMVVWDIGQGNSVMIQTRHHTLIYDTGPIGFGAANPGEKIIVPHLRAEGIRAIDQLVISHEDTDHIGGLAYLIDHFPVGQVRGSIPQEHALQQVFTAHGVAFKDCEAGQRWTWDGVEFVLWHPEPSMRSWKANERSCVLEVRNEHHSIWLTGDIEKKGETMMTRRLAAFPEEWEVISGKQVILMAPHHGSKTSSSEIFLEYLDPDHVFSQTGFQNRYRHPHPMVVERYTKRGLSLLDTVQTGAQIWRTEKEQLHRTMWREDRQQPFVYGSF